MEKIRRSADSREHYIWGRNGTDISKLHDVLTHLS